MLSTHLLFNRPACHAVITYMRTGCMTDKTFFINIYSKMAELMFFNDYRKVGVIEKF